MYSVERAMAKAAASLLPGLLPTPPTKPCLIILPASFASNPKPGRADSVERWDAHKKHKKPSPASSCSSSSSPFSGSSRASSSSSSSSRPSSTSPGGRWDSNKRLPHSRTTSADRWDTHKKPCPAQAAAVSWTGHKEDQEDDKTAMVLKPTAPRIGPMFSGPSFLASPDSSMLPMPTFFCSRNAAVRPVQAF
ncbi:hypothetical protein VPH35_094248 [Triticum aestivum]